MNKDYAHIMQDDIIRRSDAIEAIESRQTEQWIESDVDYNSGLESALCEIKALPSAEPRTGEWIECLAYNPDLDADVLCIECNQCGHRPYFSGTYRPNYCEECGARMTPYKGGDDE